jgi:hypothetical protein
VITNTTTTTVVQVMTNERDKARLEMLESKVERLRLEKEERAAAKAALKAAGKKANEKEIEEEEEEEMAQPRKDRKRVAKKKDSSLIRVQNSVEEVVMLREGERGQRKEGSQVKMIREEQNIKKHLNVVP